MSGMRGHKSKPNAVLKVGPARPRKPPTAAQLAALASSPTRKKRYSKKQVLEAITATNGLVHAAARRLGCTRQALNRYFHRYPDLQIALDDIRDSRVDVAEHHLMEQVQQNNTQATIFLLRCLGKGRGWVEDPKVQLHAHVEAGSGTWMEIMERVLARESKVIDVVAPSSPNRQLEKGIASDVPTTSSDSDEDDE